MTPEITTGTMPRARRSPLLIALYVIAAAAVVAMILFLVRLRGVQPSSGLADFGAVPGAQLTERSGKPMNLDALHGKVWVASFIFTRCAGSCPAMSAKMGQLQDSLASVGNALLVSFTVDPDNDTPGKLRDYAETYKARADKWLFLTGSRDQMQDLAKNAFHLGIEEGTDPAEPIIHSKRFVLVDSQGHIRGYYSSDEPEAQRKLLADVALLVKEAQ